jgi:hypothetical protein
MSFTTEPKLKIFRGHTITIRRAYNVAKHLKQCGFKTGDILTDDDVDNAVFHCVGGDYRTAKRYKGYDIYTRPKFSQGAMVEPGRFIKHVKGYLERLHILSRSDKGYRLFLGVIDFSNGEASGMSIGNLCVCSLDKVLDVKLPVNDATNDYNNNNTQHTQISRVKVKHSIGISKHIESIIDLTPEELAILTAKPVDTEPDRSTPIRSLAASQDHVKPKEKIQT